ncbi:MAG: hypothetical protein IKI22_04990 [Neisseriaceae bacterium]|nr:hypothetical protein [Neisseriaceae bacterium]
MEQLDSDCTASNVYTLFIAIAKLTTNDYKNTAGKVLLKSTFRQCFYNLPTNNLN